MIKLSLITFITLASAALSVKKSQDNVVMMVEMARHGTRAPMKVVTERPWITEAGAGELTTVGERQRYNLGLQTKLRYPKFFTNTFRPEEYWLRSTFFNRTIMSAVAHAQALFDMVDEYVVVPFDNDDSRLLPPQDMIQPPTKEGYKTPLPKGIIPFPIHSRLGIDREMWSYGACPNAKKTWDKAVDDYSKILAKSDKFNAMFDDALTRLKNKNYDKDSPLLERCFEASDFFIMDNKNSDNPIIPDDVTKYPNANIFKRCYDLHIFGVYRDMEMAKITATPLLNQIKEYFNEKADQTKTKKQPLKYI